MPRTFAGLLASFIFLSSVSFADTPQRKTAVLIEAHSSPRCFGLDCPPWPVPDDIDFCFQAGANFYTGIYRPWGVPWATAGKRLLAWKGKSVEIMVTDEQISVMAPRINLHLKRVHDDSAFRLASCSQN